ncbi:hypothetical protein ACFYVR_15870 [Rhodococcus sp. NPDC003318]|uniref:hypothetical protein n=1 Tax=Rhodococcus sp. NPDC003318 TaxID=3364503 RepID=UPI0036B79BC3
MAHPGWWCVVEIGQGGGVPDTLHGPYWDEDEASSIAETLTDDARKAGRRDRFFACALNPSEED